MGLFKDSIVDKNMIEEEWNMKRNKNSSLLILFFIKDIIIWNVTVIWTNEYSAQYI